MDSCFTESDINYPMWFIFMDLIKSIAFMTYLTFSKMRNKLNVRLYTKEIFYKLTRGNNNVYC